MNAKQLLTTMALVIGVALPAWAAVDLNSATQSELESVRGIGPAKAKAIIEYREKHGPFKSVDELANVKGFGPGSVAKMKPDLEAKPVKGAEKGKN